MKVLDRYVFKINRLERQESDFFVKKRLCNLIALCERLAEVDLDCRKAWQSEGKILTPEFICGVLLPNIFVAIGEHERTMGREERPRWMTREDWFHVQTLVQEELAPLKIDLEKEYRGEAGELTNQESRNIPAMTSQTVAAEAPSASGYWFNSAPDTLRRRQIVLKNPRMPSKNLSNVFDKQVPAIPLPGDWRAEFNANTWSEAYKKPKARKRIQKIISTDKHTGKQSRGL